MAFAFNPLFFSVYEIYTKLKITLHSQAESKMDGYSFIVRVKDEEATLEACLRSLFGILVSYEILVFLNMISDNSTRIARALAFENPRIKIYEYNHALARPGYEMLATDSDSNHSLVSFYNWSLEKARYKWKVKWDADFTMTAPLLDFLNTLDLKQEKIFHIGALNNDGLVEYNDYISSCLRFYKKDLFWEMPGYTLECERVLRTDLTIRHISSLNRTKAYWNNDAWFDSEISLKAKEAKTRYVKLVRDFGAEPRGFVRSENIKAAIKLGERIITSGIDYVRHDQ
jgi:glycosyltransferase involved in cell wall biosynthesis